MGALATSAVPARSRDLVAAPAGPSAAGDDLDEELLERVRRHLADRDLPPTSAAVAAVLRDSRSRPVDEVGLLRLVARLRAELVGAGPLEPLLRDPAVTDVLVNGPDEVWVDRGAGLARTPVSFPEAAAVRRLAQRLATACGRRLDDGQPWVDARLPDGTRVHAVLPPVATAGPYLSLRTFRPSAYSLAELVRIGSVDAEAARLVADVVRSRLAFLVSGGAGSGKTTVLAALLSLVDQSERIVLVEDAAELRPTHPHVVGLESRPPNADGAGAVSLRDLVRQALRMRPDRVVVGECRGAEVVELLAALNTGHDGGAGTLHANSAHDIPARLEALAALGGLGRDALHSQLAAAVRCAVHLRRTGGQRVVDTVCVLDRDAVSERVVALPAWRRDGGPTPGAQILDRLLRERGVR